MFIAKGWKRAYSGKLDRSYIGREVERLTRVGFGSISDIDAFLDANYELFRAFIEEWMKFTQTTRRKAEEVSGGKKDAVRLGASLYWIYFYKIGEKVADGRELPEDVQSPMIDAYTRIYNAALKNINRGAGA